MPFPGYAGKILFVDLTQGKIWEEPEKEEDVEGFLGGVGINYRLAAEYLDPKIDPLSKDNVLIFGAGPFSGTIVPGSAELSATTKFPLNNAIASGKGGGGFPMMLKSSGYDHLVVLGKARAPVYLRICNKEVALEDARKLWGKDHFQTAQELIPAHEPCSIITIGQAGENLVKISLAYIDNIGTLGSGGLAAVMGSKNLKAIVAQQGDHPVKVAHRVKLQELVEVFHQRIQSWQGRPPLIEGGMEGQFMGEWLSRPQVLANWSRGHFRTPQEVKELEEYFQKLKANRKALACPGCPQACKEVVHIPSGPYAGTVFYGHLISPFPGGGDIFGRSVKYMFDLNRYGICFYDFTNLLSLVSYLQEEEILTEKEVGLRVREGDLEAALKLIEMTAFRRGFGDALAEGLPGISQHIPGAEPYLVHIKGRSPFFDFGVAFDPRVRGLGTMEFTQLTNPRGAHIASGGSPSYVPDRPPSDFARHGERMGIPPEAISRIVPENSFNPGRFTRYSEDWCSLFDCLGLCNRAFLNRFYHISTVTDLYNAITGRGLEPSQMMTSAERAWNLWRLLNQKAGFTRRDDLPPDNWLVPLKAEEGRELPLRDYYNTASLTRSDVERLLDEYYSERGWDKATGMPTPSKIKELGLEKFS